MVLLKYFLSLLFTHKYLVLCASAAVHMHSLDSQERELDGSFRSRDSNHYSAEGDHGFEFDHEAILGARCFIPFLFMTPCSRRSDFAMFFLVVDKKRDTSDVDAARSLFSRAIGLGCNVLLLSRECERSSGVRQAVT